MEVNGVSGLFPLNLVFQRWAGYYMNSLFEIFSTRVKNELRQLKGSKAGRYHYFTLDGVTYTRDHLKYVAQEHSRFAVEVRMGTPSGRANEIRPMQPREVVDMAFRPVTDTGMVILSADRVHAKNMTEGIQKKGYLIATVQDGKLVFGTDPKVHLTSDSVRDEMKRLAQLKPGTRFVRLQIVESCVAGGVQFE